MLTLNDLTKKLHPAGLPHLQADLQAAQGRAQSYVELLESSGFGVAAKSAAGLLRATRLEAKAKEFYPWITGEDVAAFNEMLLNKTSRTTQFHYSYKQLEFVEASKYTELPPADVLAKVAEAKKRKIFDTFQVAYIKTIHLPRDPDPIVFGKIHLSRNYFYIAQWGDDVKFNDILDLREPRS